jgi:exportin-2 (importin alpha re-exporter)
MTLLLNCHPAGQIPPTYRNLLPMILQPSAWENYGNVPALVGFLGATLQKDPAYVVSTNTLSGYLGIFQKLIASKANDQYGFELLGSIVTMMPM